MPHLSNTIVFILLFFAATVRADAVESSQSVWLVSNGFHTSLAFRTRDFPTAGRWSGDAEADHLLIGWGAADFYRGSKGLWTICRSTLWPSAGALHVVPIRGAVARRFARSDVIRLTLPPAQHRRLLRELEASFARDAAGRPLLLGPGSFTRSRFYAGRDRFCLLQMCNTWVAKKLRRAGMPIFIPTAITAGGLAQQAAKLGEREQRRSKPLDAF